MEQDGREKEAFQTLTAGHLLSFWLLQSFEAELAERKTALANNEEEFKVKSDKLAAIMAQFQGLK